MLEATGERLVPDEQRGELVLAEHLARYRFAAQLASGKRVLDVACGEGYGAAMLAAAGAESVTGADVDSQTIEHAAAKYEGPDFTVADIATLPFDDGTFDLVVSFETIEHVPEPEQALGELRRVLAPDGALVISTPNKREYRVENEFHVREFTHEEFAEVLRARFEQVQLLYQQNWLASTVSGERELRLADGSTQLDIDTVKVEGRERGRELYTIAICGPASAELRPQAVLSGVYEAHEMAERLAAAERTAERWHGEFQRAEDTAKRWHAEYEEAKRVAEQWHDASQEWEEEAERRGRVIAEMEESVSWRVTRPLRSAASRTRRNR